MEDNEIKKALECCSSQPQELCCNCPIDIRKIKGGCITALTTNALDLINRLQAENSKLLSNLTSLQNDLTDAEAENERLRDYNENLLTANTALSNEILEAKAENERLTHITRNLIGEIKAEAYKEFAERLKEDKEVVLVGSSGNHYRITDKEIDNLLKEMVGEDNDDT